LARHALDDLAAVDHDPHARRALRDGGGRLSRLQHQAPGAHAVAVDQLLVAFGPCAGREAAGLRGQERGYDVVERGCPHIGAAMRLRLFGEGGIATLPRWPRRGGPMAGSPSAWLVISVASTSTLSWSSE